MIGVGNPYRHDDAAGLAAAERLAGRLPEGVAIVGCEQEPTRIMDAWQGAAAAIVVDAVVSGAAPGTVHRVDATVDRVPADVFRSSTHAFGVGDVIELARALGRLPKRVVVYGIEGTTFAAGAGLTAPVEAGVDAVVEAVADDVGRLEREEEPCTSGR